MSGGNSSGNNNKPLLELYVKASSIDSRRIGACLFCQEFWMELYALYEVGCVRVEVKTVNVNSEGFKRNFSGAQPPIMVEEDKAITYADNSEIERRIFHLCQEFNVPLFEKDLEVEKTIQNLYRDFKIFLQAKANYDKGKKQPSTIEGLPAQVSASHNKVIDQLTRINQLLAERRTQYLLGDTMTEYDCEVMPRLHHMRIIGERLLGFYIPRKLTHLWNYILTTYRTAAFIESCPADQDILNHYKEQLNLNIDIRVTLEAPTKSLTIPEEVLQSIRRLNNSN